MEPQQSPLYAQYMKRLKWDVVAVDGTNIFLKKFPLMGGIAKIHRPEKLPSLAKLIPILQSHHIQRLVLEPHLIEDQSHVTTWVKNLPSNIRLNRSPYLPTKTIHIDLTQTTENIFASFTEAKRRAVRRAQKADLIVKESTNIDALIRVKNTSAGLFGFITTSGIRELWETFAPKHAAILLAYDQARHSSLATRHSVVGGVLLLFWDHVAYYWIAGATHRGKKHFAPTLLVFKALALAKKRGARTFDFVGIWDERIPKQNLSWKGFTKFKEGFGGTSLYYPIIQ